MQKLTVKKIEHWETWEWYLKKHYAHKLCPISHSFGLFQENILCGVAGYGPGPLSFNDSSNIFTSLKVRVLELRRLITNDDLPKNALSFFVSRSLKMIPFDFVAVSYSNPNFGHNGYIYQATNWIYTGLSSSEPIYIKNGEQVHRRTLYERYGPGAMGKIESMGFTKIPQAPKHRYFYFKASKKLKNKMKSEFKFKISPYPKGKNTNYDASHQPTIQGRLF